jgi:segregation and condensation protein B
VRFYIETKRGFELRHAGGGWRYATRPEHASVISAYVLEGQHGRLSQAALETLAVIAYLQPASRSRISAVRGVNVDGVVRTLLARDLIIETGRDPISGAVLFTTTPYFLERMGLTVARRPATAGAAPAGRHDAGGRAARGHPTDVFIHFLTEEPHDPDTA